MFALTRRFAAVRYMEEDSNGRIHGQSSTRARRNPYLDFSRGVYRTDLAFLARYHMVFHWVIELPKLAVYHPNNAADRTASDHHH